MKSLKLYFLFFKSNFLFPLVLSVFASLYSQNSAQGVITLVVASIMVWFYERFINDSKKQKLYFYFNFGISEFKLHLFTFCINLFLLIMINLVYL